MDKWGEKDTIDKIHEEQNRRNISNELSNDTIIPMLLWCPECKGRHIDTGIFATKPHHTHACQHCGHVWRPALVYTLGVQFLPGFKNVEG